MEKGDLGQMARIRAAEWETREYWEARLSGYLSGQLSPQKALASRAGFVALDGDSVAGFVAGHLTKRFGCDGELQWINVAQDYRGSGVGSALLRLLAAWFVEQQALRVCVNVGPDNAAAIQFYTRHGAVKLNEHWMVWNDIRTLCN
jgi:ribosomal protein S18 acetylase RimI-like enzyme